MVLYIVTPRVDNVNNLLSSNYNETSDSYNTQDIFEYFIDRVNEYRHIGKAYVTSAIELDEEIKNTIEQRLIDLTDYKEFKMSYTVDKNIIGGLIIRIGDRIVDSSIRNKIDSMCHKLEKIHIS